MKRFLLILMIVALGCTTQQREAKNTVELYDYDIEARLETMGITLPEPKMPKDVNIVFAVRSGDLIYLSGNGPILPNGDKITGKIGIDISIEEGYEAARLTAINLLAVLKSEIGDLNTVEKIVKVFGMVNADPLFTEHPAVINGFSDLMIDVFGKRGQHARSAVGVSSLPWDLACEIEMIVKLKPLKNE